MYFLRLSVLGACVLLISGKPTTPAPEAGPCIGMDCLHGVLMHGDEEMGEKHQAEDSYIQLKEELAAGGEKKQAGPCEGMDCLHGVLMHGDDEQGGTGHAEEPIGPQKVEEPAEFKPEDPNEYFHGVLMHNDGDAGKHHKNEQDEVVKMEIPQKPQDLEEYWHGVLMHNDTEPGKRHHDGPHSEDADGKASEPQGKVRPLSGDDMMHGVLMHDDETGAEGHDHESAEGEANVTGRKIKPLTGDDLMHGLVMHGEEDGESDHSEEEKKKEEYEDSHPKNVKIGPDTDQLHGLLMHGDMEHGVDHDEEHKKLSGDEGIPQGSAGVTDPESMLHSDGFEHIDPKDIDLTKISAQDKDDFNEWQKEEKKSPDEEIEDLKSDWRQTVGYITDGLLSDLELMKRRYLARFYTPQEEPTPAEKLEAEWLNSAAGYDDMRHELNLIGDTGPIGEARHNHDDKDE